MFKINKQVPIEDLISRQISFWETSQKKSIARQAGLYPNITISRDPGSRGAYLAQKISDQLNWKIYGREIVDFISNNTHVRKSLVELFDEKTRNEMDNLLSALMNSHAMSNEMYLKHLAKTIVSIGKHSNAIILGRGANFILPDNMALKIRIVEDLQDRIKNMTQGTGDIKETKRFIKKEENDRSSFITKFFAEKIDNPAHYDLTINLSKLDLPEATDVVIYALQKKYDLPESDLKETEN